MNTGLVSNLLSFPLCTVALSVQHFTIVIYEVGYLHAIISTFSNITQITLHNSVFFVTSPRPRHCSNWKFSCPRLLSSTIRRSFYLSRAILPDYGIWLAISCGTNAS
jgi:hypothetical protein